jgi:hypothetical protein
MGLQKLGYAREDKRPFFIFAFVIPSGSEPVVGYSAGLLFAIAAAVTLVESKVGVTFSGTLAVTGVIQDIVPPAPVQEVRGIDKKFTACLQDLSLGHLKPGDKFIYPAVQKTEVDELKKRVSESIDLPDLLPVTTVEDALRQVFSLLSTQCETLQQVLPLLSMPSPVIKSWEPRPSLRRGWQVPGAAISRVLGRLVMPRAQRRKVYKFALIGQRGAGKTCLLTVLTIPCRDRQGQVDCSWLPEPVGMPRPAGEPPTWTSRDPAAAFHRGKAWVEQTRSSLLSGVAPQSNPLDPEELRLLYRFTTPSGRQFDVELMDYSGEWLHPSWTNDPLTQRLWERLTAQDGLLVLAEFPASYDTAPRWWEKLEDLTVACYNLQEQRERRDTGQPPREQAIPVALLVNKWDRHGALDYAHPERERKALDQFLERRPPPPHQKLVEVLKRMAQGNFAVFPVSALGATTRLLNGNEIPQHVQPLRSFGLEEGFIFLAHQRDKLDLAQYGAKVGKRLCVIAVVLFLVVGLLVGSETLFDDVEWRRFSATLQTPQATRQDFRAAIDWLRAYASAPGYRHLGSRWLVLSPTTARTRLQDLDEQAWQGVVTVVDPEQQAHLAQRYFDEYGANGKYRQEAQGLIDAAKQRQHMQANWQHLRDMDTQLQAMQTRSDRPGFQPQELQELRQRLQQVPHPEAVTQELVAWQATLRALVDTALAQQRRTEQEYENRQHLTHLDGAIHRLLGLAHTEADLRTLRDEIDELPHPMVRSSEIETRQEELRQRLRTATEAQLAVEARTRWQQFVAQYHALMQGEKQVIAAWQHLHTWQPKTADLEKLFQHFQTQMLAMLEAYWSGLLKQHPRAWPEARDAIDRVSNYPDIRAILTRDQQKRLKEMRSKIDVAEDRTLYEDVVRKQDRDSTARYLKDAPVKKQARVVREYQKYLDKMQSTLPLTLILERIEWGNTWNGYENTVIVSVNGQMVIVRTKVEGMPEQSTPIDAAYSFPAKLKDRLRLYIKVTCQPYNWWQRWWQRWWQSSWNAGEGMYDNIVEKVDEQKLPLKAAGHENQAHFRLEGKPSPPPLPDWDTP